MGHFGDCLVAKTKHAGGFWLQFVNTQIATEFRRGVRWAVVFALCCSLNYCFGGNHKDDGVVHTLHTKSGATIVCVPYNFDGRVHRDGRV